VEALTLGRQLASELISHRDIFAMRNQLSNYLSSMRVTLLIAIAISFSSPVLADILVFGGTTGVGLETVRQLRKNGEAVTVLVRETSDLAGLNAVGGVTTTVGDALDMESVTRAYASGEYELVLSTLGGHMETGFEVDSVGNINAIDGAKAAGVDRFVLVTAIGAGDSRAAPPAKMLQALSKVLVEKEKAERHMIDSGLTWTIIRPGFLKDKPANGEGILTQDTSAIGAVGRAEVARLIVESARNEAAYGKIYSAIEQ
jgi:uncharacterized protein YbjT (DUF2867 family)